jgi:dihydroneopterin aldolase
MDIVFIKQLQIDTVIGVYEWEKTIQQRLEVDLELATDIRQAATADDIRLTLDYAVIAEQVQQLICAEPIELIETVAEKIASMLLSRFATRGVMVTVSKPGAVKTAATVGVRIRRGQW